MNLISYSNIINKDIFSIKTILNNDFYEEMIDVINLIDKQEPENQNIEYLYLTDNEYLDSDENKYFCKDENCSPYPTLDNINDGRIFCNEGYYDEYKNGNCVCVKNFDKIIDTVSKIVSKEGRSFIGTLNATAFPDEELDIVVDHILNIKKKEVGRELKNDEISSIIKSIKSPNKNDVIKEFIAGLKIDNKDMKNFKKVKKMMGGMKYKYNAKDIFNMDINATKEINQIYTRLSKLSQYDICNMKKNNFIHYLLDDVLKFDKSEQKGGFRYKLDETIRLNEYNSIDKQLLPYMEKGYTDANTTTVYANPEYTKRSNNITVIHNNSIEYLLEKSYDFNLNYNSKIDIDFNIVNLQQKTDNQPLFQTINKFISFFVHTNNKNVIPIFDNYSKAAQNYLFYFLTNKTLDGNEPNKDFFKDIWKIMIQKKKGLFSLGYKGIYKILDFFINFRLNINNNKYELIGKKSFKDSTEKKKHFTDFLINCVEKERYSNEYRIIYDKDENKLIQDYMNEFIEYFQIIFINPIVEKLTDNTLNKFPDDIIEKINVFLDEFKSGDIKTNLLNNEMYSVIKSNIIEGLKWNIDKIGITEENIEFIKNYNEIINDDNFKSFVKDLRKNKKNYYDNEFKYYFHFQYLYKLSELSDSQLYKILKLKNIWRANEYYCVFKQDNSQTYAADSKSIFTNIDGLKGHFSIVKILNKTKSNKGTIDTVNVTEDFDNNNSSERDPRFFIPFSLIFRKGSTVSIKNDTSNKTYPIKDIKYNKGNLIFTLENNTATTISNLDKNWDEITITREKFIEDKNNKKLYDYKPFVNDIVAYYDYEQYRWDVIKIEFKEENNVEPLTTDLNSYAHVEGSFVDDNDVNDNDDNVDDLPELIPTQNNNTLVELNPQDVQNGGAVKWIGKSLYYKDYIIEDIDKKPELITHISSALILDNNKNNDKVSKINELLNFVLEGEDNKYLGLKLNIFIALHFYNVFHDITNKSMDFKLIQPKMPSKNDYKEFFKFNFVLNYNIIQAKIHDILFDNLKTYNNIPEDFPFYTDNYLAYVYNNYNFEDEKDFDKIKEIFKNIFKFNSYKILYTFLEKYQDKFENIKDAQLKKINDIIQANLDYKNSKEILKVISYYNNKYKKPIFKIRFYIIDNKMYTLYDLATIRDTFLGKFIYNEKIINTLSLYHINNKNEYDEDIERTNCLGFSLLDIACEFGNFELAFHLVDKYNFDYNKTDKCGVTPAMRAFASIDNNKMDDTFSNEYFIKFFEKIEEKIRTEHKDNDDKIMEEISKLYNWKIPYFVIFNNNFINKINDVINGKNTENLALTPSYFNNHSKLLFNITAIAAVGIGAYFATGFIPIGYIAGNYFGYVVSESIATALVSITAGVVVGQGVVQTIYLFNLNEFLESKYNLSTDIELDYQMLYYKYNKYLENINQGKQSGEKEKVYTKSINNLYDMLNTHNNDLNEQIKKNTFLKGNNIRVINNIDIATIYYKYYGFINSNPLYFLTKFRNTQLFEYYLSKISPSPDKTPSKNLLFYKIDHIDNLILSQAITTVYKCLQPNFLITIINAVFTKLYLFLKNKATIGATKVVAHTFVSFMSGFSGPLIAFIIHLIIEALGCYMKYVSNGITPSLFTIITDSVFAIVNALGNTASNLYTILQGAFSLFHTNSVSDVVNTIVTIFRITLKWFTGELNSNRKNFNELIKQLESFEIENVNDNKENETTKKINIKVNNKEQSIEIIKEDTKPIEESIKKQLEEEFKNKDKETAFNINLSEFAGEYYDKVKDIISMFFIDKITITKEYETHGSSILKKLDDNYIEEIKKKLKLYRGDKGDGFNEIPITECYNSELVTPYVINYTKVYEKLNEKKLSEYIGFSNNEKEKELMITNDIQKKYTEINGYINTFEHYKTYLIRNTYYELLIIQYKLNKKFVFFSIKNRVNSLIRTDNLRELEMLLKSSDITEYLLSGDNSFLAFGKTIKGYTPMHYIITENKLNYLTLIFDNVSPIEKATLLFARTLTKQSLFHIAVRLDDPSILEYLLQIAMDLSKKIPEDTLTEYKSKILLNDEKNLTKVINETNFFKLIFNLEDKFKLNFYDNASEKYRLIINTYYTNATGEKDFDSLLRVNRLGLVARKVENNKIVNRGTIIRVNYNDKIYQAEYINYDKDEKKVNIELLTKSDKKIRVTSILDKFIIEPIKIEDSLLNMYVGKTVTKELKIKITEKPNIKQSNFVGQLNEFDGYSKQLIKFCNSQNPDTTKCNEAFGNIKIKHADDINSINREILDILKNMFNRETVEYKIKVYNTANKFNISEFDIKNNIEEYNTKEKLMTTK